MTNQMTDPQTSVDELIARRDAAAAAYYEGESLMSDEEFDILTAELAAAGVDETVGHGYTPEGRVRHERPMLSLAKVHTSDEVAKFLERLSVVAVDVELKYDGLAISLIYDRPADGGAPTLTRAVTRGNGIFGEDVTHAITQMAAAGHVPLTLQQTSGDHLEFRGEIMLDHDSFARVNEAAGGKYSNPRNAAAGILRRQSGTEARELSLIIHDIGATAAAQVARLGFTTPSDHYRAFLTMARTEDVMRAIDEIDALRLTLPFDTDGVVIKAANIFDRDRLGEGSRTPNWAIAFKFASEIKQTRLLDVAWQLGRTGKLVPVAQFEPVLLVGATVTQATLHNAKFIDGLDLQIGDILDVTRSGEVIPYVLGATAADDRTPIVFPTSYAARDGQTYPVVRDDVNLRVDGYTDPVPNIVYGIQTLGILGVAESLVTKLVEAGLVTDLADMIGVTPEQIAGLDRHGQKSAENAVKAIHDGLQGATTGRWFATLGIQGLGRTTGRVLERQFGTLDAIAQATEADLAGLEGFGPITTRDLLANRHRVAALAQKLRTIYAIVPAPEAQAPVRESNYTGKNVVVTGTFPTMKRSDVEKAITELGGVIRGSVSKSTDILVAGADAGSKLAKATELGVDIITAEEFESEYRG